MADSSTADMPAHVLEMVARLKEDHKIELEQMKERHEAEVQSMKLQLQSLKEEGRFRDQPERAQPRTGWRLKEIRSIFDSAIDALKTKLDRRAKTIADVESIAKNRLEDLRITVVFFINFIDTLRFELSAIHSLLGKIPTPNLNRVLFAKIQVEKTFNACVNMARDLDTKHTSIAIAQLNITTTEETPRVGSQGS